MLSRFKTLAVKTLAVLFATLPAQAFADDLNGANTAWILTATALVLFMTIPGLSLFYGGLVRSKECTLSFNAMFCDYLSRINHLVRCRLQHGLW